MKTDEVIKLSQELERDIASLIMKFEAESGRYIASLSLQRFRKSVDGEPWRADVSVAVTKNLYRPD
jgi:hypothetical protein